MQPAFEETKLIRERDGEPAFEPPRLLALVFLILYRLGNAFTTRTFFQPDEYFQSLEPAWQLAFGLDSGAWITWEWREQLRSSMHPILFAAVYRAAAQVGDVFGATPYVKAELLLAAPKILEAIIAALGDYFTFRLAHEIHDERMFLPLFSVALSMLSPWQWFCSTRTLSNSLETTLTVLALSYWPWRWFLRPVNRSAPATKENKGGTAEHYDQSTAGLNMALTAAAFACILRPTNIVIWATVTIMLLVLQASFAKMGTLARGALTCGSAVLAVSISMDRMYYGEWTFPPLKFLYFNVVQSLSVFYGVNRTDYYFSEGLPLLLTTALPFTAIGLWQSLKPAVIESEPLALIKQQSRFVLALAVVVMVLVMTTISHKEVRFIYPLLPFLHVLAAKPFTTFVDPSAVPLKKARLAVVIGIVIVNTLIAGYVSVFHQKGVIDVMHYLRHEQEARLHPVATGQSADMTVGFLMPCHSTPWRSHLVHPEIQAWALTCEPPLNVPIEERATYLDEADIFYADPTIWLSNNMVDRRTIRQAHSLTRQTDPKGDGERRAWPEYLVFFQQLEPVMEDVLKETRYHECWRGFNTQWHDDWRRQGDVAVWCLRS